MGRIELWIDGRKITAEEGTTVLQASLASDIYIPHLCYHPDLEPQGGCKLCVVEIDGDPEPVTSCNAIARDGMRVCSKSAQLDKLRRISMELMLASHPHDCTSCKAYLNCELQALMQYLGVAHARMRSVRKETTRIHTQNPLIIREMERCIQCGRCVRACGELRGVSILNYRKKGMESYVGTEIDLPLAEAGCRFCGACVEVCPTGALQDISGLFKQDVPRERALVPCSEACPIHTDIPRYLRYIREGKYSEAAAVIREKSPFPFTLGYVCNHDCELECKRSKLNQAILIRALKRFAMEHDTKEIWKQSVALKPATGKKVAVIGGGPAGLTAAYYLRKLGHEVTVFDRNPVAGGMLAAGIPAYRLPRAVLAEEIVRIEEVGVKIRTGIQIHSLKDQKLKGYQAILVASGAAAGKAIPLRGREWGNSLTAVELLRNVSFGEATPLVREGRTVAVLGGGNVAFDVARTARRLGASVYVVCLEPREVMLADEKEVFQAEEEGVRVMAGKSVLSVEGSSAGVSGVIIMDVEDFCFQNGSLTVHTVPGTEQEIPVDAILFAAGQKPDLSDEFGLALNSSGYPIHDAKRMTTSAEGVFAAGDVVTGTRSVVEAVCGGRNAAAEIDRYLGGEGKIDETLTELEQPGAKIGKIEGFGYMERATDGVLPVEQRCASFCGIQLGFNQEQAIYESGRCLQCDLRTRIKNVKLWTQYAVKYGGRL